MGQIVSSAAKPKRCNLNKLSQLGTPAAGEYILVSYDNSMTANGQGNFDRYIMGDGRTAATALELKYLDDSTRPYIVEEVNKAVADIQPIEITGDVTNAPDEEDLTSENQGGTDVLKFKDKAYNAALYSGLGRVYLRKNIVTLKGTGKNVLTQAMVNTANTIYVIQYDFTLGEDITIPANCILEFDGGSISGEATITGQNTGIKAANYEIFKHGIIKYRGYKTTPTSATLEVSKVYSGILLMGTFKTEKVGSNWTGLENVGNSPADCAFQNYIKLHSESDKIIIPSGVYNVFSIGSIAANVDFSNSILNLVSPNSVYDSTIPIPESSTEAALNIPRWLIAFSKTNGTIKNLTINGMFAELKQTGVGLGSHAAIEMFSNKNMTIENVTIKNYAACAIITHNPNGINNGLTLKNVELNTIGEHGIYCHTQGDVNLIDSKFINCSYNAEIGSRMAAIIRFTGQEYYQDGSYVKLYAKNCVFYRDSEYIDPSNGEALPSTAKERKCLFNYDGAESYTFEDCSFDGAGLLGFHFLEQTSTYYGKDIEVVFKNCNSIMKHYVNSATYIMSVYNCNNVKYPFLCDYIENSKCLFREHTAIIHNSNKVKKFINCDFIEDSDGIYNSNIKTPDTNYEFINCNFKSLGTPYASMLVVIGDYANIMFSFKNVIFELSTRIFRVSPTGSNFTTFKFKDCDIKNGYGTYYSIISIDANANYRLSIDNIHDRSNRLNNPACLGIRADSPTNFRLIYSPSGPIQPRPLDYEIGVSWFNGTKPLYWTGSAWVDATGTPV